jgi:hypothetical protein
VTRACEDRAQALQDLSIVRVQQVSEPVQAPCCDYLKDDSLFPHLDRAQSRIRKDCHARGHRRGETEIICGGQAVDDDAALVSPRDCIYDARTSGVEGLRVRVFVLAR